MRCYLEDFSLLSSTCCKTEAARSVVFERTSYPPLSRLSAVQSTYNSLIPVDTNAYICSIAPCLRVLWMSTHGCFSPSFPFFYTGLSQPDAGVQELEIPRMMLHGVRLRGVVRRSQGGGLAFSIVATFVLAFLRQTCLTYVCTQLLLLPLTRL